MSAAKDAPLLTHPNDKSELAKKLLTDSRIDELYAQSHPRTDFAAAPPPPGQEGRL